MICPVRASIRERRSDCEGREVPLVDEATDGVEEVEFAPLVESTDVTRTSAW